MRSSSSQRGGDRGRIEKTKTPGIYKVHSRNCARLGGGSCSCAPGWQAAVRDKRMGKLQRKNFTLRAEAISWREDTNKAIRSGTYKRPTATTVEAALLAYVAGMKTGEILDRGGKRYKPSTVRGYERAAKQRLIPALGHFKLSEVQRRDVQDVADRLRADGAAPASVHNALDPLRACFRRAMQRDEVQGDPTRGLVLPSRDGRRDRIADPEEAERLTEALPDAERAIWATALFTGLRRGELRALRWSDVDLDRNEIRVSRSYDDGEADVPGEFIEPKTVAGRRTVPVILELRKLLLAHKLATGRDGDDLVFGRTAEDPFIPSTVRRRALDAWKTAGLDPIKLHECRHTAASLFIRAGVPLAVISKLMGHASVNITADKYGHLLPDSVAAAGDALTASLEAM